LYSAFVPVFCCYNDAKQGQSRAAEVPLLDGWPEHADAINASGLHAVDTCCFLLPTVRMKLTGFFE
jgi:hypothetical protein